MLAFTITTAVLLATILIGSLSTIFNHPHWLIRAWDFPHVQLAAITLLLTIAYFTVAAFHDNHPGWHWLIGTLALIILGWLSYGIAPYTPLAERQTKLAETDDPQRHLRIVVSNVEMENTQHELWMREISSADPAVVIALEVNERWMDETRKFREQFDYQVSYPQDNWYGMLMLSHLPILESEIRFLVSDDVPSIDAIVELPSGEPVRLLAVHPRPPEPIRDNDSAARDAELTLYGRELESEKRPVIIGGDLNDVAWSSTTRLFLRLSGMLDPRRGRGFFNSFNAKHWWMRFPLDHVFHSRHFTLRSIRRLDWVGSDHFPMLLDLQCEPSRKTEQQPLDTRENDQEEAAELISRVAGNESSVLSLAAARS